MKEIIVLSGKGGTGKTSVSATFPTLYEGSVMADCDVDAADLHLLLSPKVDREHDFISGHEAVINQEKCISCGKCFKVCKFDAITVTGREYKVEEISCEGCKVCVELCPVDAIDFPDSHCGEWYESTTEYGPMVHADLKPGAENSGKLVSLVRKEAKVKAEEIGADWIIVDGPPGIGCPVISSVTGANALLMVTEPTLSGKHDIERVLKLANHFNVEAFVVINKWDISSKISEEIEVAAKEHSAKVVGRISYSPLFTQAQREGVPLTKFAPESSLAEEISQMWKRLLEELS